jgi:hypothetical protein
MLLASLKDEKSESCCNLDSVSQSWRQDHSGVNAQILTCVLNTAVSLGRGGTVNTLRLGDKNHEVNVFLGNIIVACSEIHTKHIKMLCRQLFAICFVMSVRPHGTT